MNFGRFAVPLENGRFYDSLRHSICDQEDLGERFLLDGQEQKAIRDVVFHRGRFQILLIPSFECNLRCPHCYVGHLLEKPSGNQLGLTDPNRLIKFVRNSEPYLGKLDNLSIVGGEPFLHPDLFREFIASGFPISVTTNGMFDFHDVQDIIGSLRHITFSIDGWPEHHNRARHPLDKDVDAFSRSYHNLCLTIQNFPSIDVRVQGSLIDDEAFDSLQIERYFLLMIGAGVKRTNINLGPCAATVKRKATEAFLNCIQRDTRKSPCCDYSLHKGFVVYANKIYPSYHRFEEVSAYASLDDDLESILNNRRGLIESSMPLLKDRICMDSCKAVGLCWGMCSSSRHVFKDGRPSSICDRNYKEELLSKVATDANSSCLGAEPNCR